MRNMKIITIGVLLTILALALGCSSSNSADTGSLGVAITPGTSISATPSAMLVTATNPSINTGGTSLINAYVVDNIGHPVADADVTFSLDNGLKGSLNSATATTDSNGNATITFTAGSTASTVVVTGAIGSVTSSTSIIIGGGGGGTVNVLPVQSAITEDSYTTVNVTVKDMTNNNAPDGTLVNFSVSSNAGSLSANSATTSGGIASITVTGASAGTVTVTASTTTYGSGSATITVTSATEDSITVAAASGSIVTNTTTKISALLSGPGFNTLPDGTVITFAVDNSSIGILSAATATTTARVAEVTLTAGGVTGTVTITASYGAVSNTTTVTVIPPTPDNLVCSATPTNITVRGTATVRATVTSNGFNVPDGTSVTFVLTTSSLGSLSASSVSTYNGVATTTFTAGANAGTASITASAGGKSGNVSVPIAAAATGSIQFVSASPQLIGLKTGGTEPTSVITFAVKDVNGNAVVDGTQVNFSMNGPGGNEYVGSTVGSTTATASTIGGNASVILHSGTVAGPVTIIASTTWNSVTMSTSATQVSIGGGVPSAKHWNLATSQFNLAGLKTSGLEASISAYIGDRFGNYNIPGGTVVSFYTEAGKINTQGTTDITGKTSVILRTQDPIPADVLTSSNEPWYTGSATLSHPTTTYNSRDGWVTILATTQGEEMFLDENGDGKFTTSYSVTACPAGYICECSGSASISSGTCASGSRSEAFFDLSEPYYDKNDDGCRNDTVYKYCDRVAAAASTDPFEEFIDANKNGVFNGPNGKWDGPDCASTGCQTSKMIWKESKVVFTGNYYFWPMPDGNNCFNTPTIYSMLVSSVTSTDTTIPVAYITTNFPASGTIKIDDEQITYSGKTAYSFTGASRGANGTLASSHNAYAWVYSMNAGGCTATYGSGSFAEAPASITKGGSGYFTVIVGDIFLNSLPGGTVFAATASKGTVTPDTVTLIDGLSSGPSYFSFVVEVPEDEEGTVTVVAVSIDDGPAITVTVPLIDP